MTGALDPAGYFRLHDQGGRTVKQTFGVDVSNGAVTRWARVGLCGIRLRTISVGGTRISHVDWMSEFFADVEVARRQEQASEPAKPTATERRLLRRRRRTRKVHGSAERA